MEQNPLFPNDLTKIALKQLKQEFDKMEQLMTYYDCAILEVETKLKVLNKQFSLQHNYNPIETIKTRLKTPESIVDKLNRRNATISVESIEKEVHDVAGIRVICPFLQDIYLIADCLLEQDDVTLVKKKDYISKPKSSGYRSLHLIIETPIFLQNEKRLMKVEIQLRTIAMDFWASLEHHIRYKKDLDLTDKDNIFLELKNCAEDSAMLDKRMENVKNAISQKQSENKK